MDSTTRSQRYPVLPPVRSAKVHPESDLRPKNRDDQLVANMQHEARLNLAKRARKKRLEEKRERRASRRPSRTYDEDYSSGPGIVDASARQQHAASPSHRPTPLHSVDDGLNMSRSQTNQVLDICFYTVCCPCICVCYTLECGARTILETNNIRDISGSSDTSGECCLLACGYCCSSDTSGECLLACGTLAVEGSLYCCCALCLLPCALLDR